MRGPTYVTSGGASARAAPSKLRSNPAGVQMIRKRAGAPVRFASVCATHHVEELPPTTTHALLLRGGRVVAAGAADDVIASAPLSACFELPIEVERREGRFAARAAGAWAP